MKKILLSLLLTVIYTQGTFSGVTYFDYTYDLSEDAINDDGFGLKRVYFTYQETLSENISYKFQTDIDYKSSPINVYLKNAKLDWKSPIGKLTFGMQGMNIFNVTEKTWGFRFLQKSAMDKYKFSSSADIGVAYSGKMNNLNYSIMYTNGSGYKETENDEHKKTSIQLVYGEKKLVKNDGFNIGLSFAFEPYDEEQEDEGSTIITNNTMLLSLYSGYAKNGLRVGGEFDRYRDDGSNLTKQIIAAYISYQFTEKLQGLFYIDNYESDKYNDGDVNTDMIIGLNYKPEKGLTMTPNIRISTPEEGDSTTMFMLNFEFKF
tara:strand:+ start:553 stop:1506 length:954 start_codon:yes stop_codon:yes gene_type:complete